MKTEPTLGSAELIDLVDRHSAHNYHPLPVVVAEAEGAWVTDVEGTRYLDMLADDSALNFGHRHPDLIRAAKEQLDRVTLTSRAFHHDLFGPFCEQLADLGVRRLAQLFGRRARELALVERQAQAHDPQAGSQAIAMLRHRVANLALDQVASDRSLGMPLGNDQAQPVPFNRRWLSER